MLCKTPASNKAWPFNLFVTPVCNYAGLACSRYFNLDLDILARVAVDGCIPVCAADIFARVAADRLRRLFDAAIFALVSAECRYPIRAADIRLRVSKLARLPRRAAAIFCKCASVNLTPRLASDMRLRVSSEIHIWDPPAIKTNPSGVSACNCAVYCNSSVSSRSGVAHSSTTHKNAARPYAFHALCRCGFICTPRISVDMCECHLAGIFTLRPTYHRSLAIHHMPYTPDKKDPPRFA